MKPASDFCAKCGNRFLDASDQFCARCGTARERRMRLTIEPPKRKPVGIFLMAFAFAIVPLVGLCVMALASSEVAGTLSATGPRAFTFAPAACESLHMFGGAGANIVGKAPNDGGMVVSIDAIKGPQVVIKIPGTCKNGDGTDCATLEVRREDCKRWDVRAEFSGTIINRVRQYEGHTRLDCTFGDGTHLVADLTFDGC